MLEKVDENESLSLLFGKESEAIFIGAARISRFRSFFIAFLIFSAGLKKSLKSGILEARSLPSSERRGG